MSELISVIIPIYKVEDYLDECISSVVNQTHKNLEIILVDDGSPDNCGMMCDEWAKKDDRIKVVHKSNGGLSDARNAGLNIAVGEYIAFIDSDDFIMPNMFEELYSAFDTPEIDIVACGITNHDGQKQTVWGCYNYIGNAEQILAMLYNDFFGVLSFWNQDARRIGDGRFRRSCTVCAHIGC